MLSNNFKKSQNSPLIVKFLFATNEIDNSSIQLKQIIVWLGQASQKNVCKKTKLKRHHLPVNKFRWEKEQACICKVLKPVNFYSAE